MVYIFDIHEMLRARPQKVPEGVSEKEDGKQMGTVLKFPRVGL